MQAWTHEELTSQIITLSLKGMSRRAVARSLGISRNTVRKAIETHRQGRNRRIAHCQRQQRLPRVHQGYADGTTDQIVELLAKYPDITAQRGLRGSTRGWIPRQLRRDQGAGTQAAAASETPTDSGNASDGAGENERVTGRRTKLTWREAGD